MSGAIAGEKEWLKQTVKENILFKIEKVVYSNMYKIIHASLKYGGTVCYEKVRVAMVKC